MLTIDWILLALWFLGAIRGWLQGLVKQLVSIAGILLGLLLAKVFYTVLGDVLSPHLNEHHSLANILSFVLIWVTVPIGFGLVGEVITTFLDKLLVLGTFNRLCGAVVGFLKYTFILGALVWVLNLMGIIGAGTMQESVLCSHLKAFPEAVYATFVTDKGNAAE